jgi:hypothetical protein
MKLSEAANIMRKFGKATSQSYEKVTGEKFELNGDFKNSDLFAGLAAYVALDWADSVEHSNVDDAYKRIMRSLQNIVLDMIEEDKEIKFT